MENHVLEVVDSKLSALDNSSNFGYKYISLDTGLGIQINKIERRLRVSF